MLAVVLAIVLLPVHALGDRVYFWLRPSSARLKEWCMVWQRATAQPPPSLLLCCNRAVLQPKNHFYIEQVVWLANHWPFCCPKHAPGLRDWTARAIAWRCLSRARSKNENCRRSSGQLGGHGNCTTLNGGSLGSCVDEERSKLCELM